MSEHCRFRSPSVGVDEFGDVDLNLAVPDACVDFSSHNQAIIQAVLRGVYPLAPVEGFKNLLAAAIIAHARVADAAKLLALPVGAEWRQEMLTAIAEFCSVIGRPLPLPSDQTPQEIRSYSTRGAPVEIPPTPASHALDPMVEDPETPLAPTASLPVAPPPTAPRPRARPPPLAPPAKGAKGKGRAPAVPPPVQKPSYAAAASATATAAPPKPSPPPRASLVISCPGSTSANSLVAQAAMRADLMAYVCTEALAAQPAYANVRVSAAKWTPKGNLVVFAGPDTTHDQLLSASHILTSAVSSRLNTPEPSRLVARANVKWSKILINGVPLFAAGPAPGPASSAACHASLVEHNPAYKALRVTQMPSWVRAPATYNSAAKDKSSLVVAFEDPDGSLARDLIKGRSLFVFGAQAVVRKWKYKPPSPNTRVRRIADARLAAQVVAGTIKLPDKPGTQAQAPAHRAGHPSAPVATGAAADRPPTPAPPEPSLIHSPPTDPIGRPAKKSRKKKAA